MSHCLSLPQWPGQIFAWWHNITWKRGKILKYCVYATIFGILVAFAVLAHEYLYIPSDLQKVYPQSITTENFTATAITCGYPLSGYYGLMPVSIAWALVPLTVLLRRARWVSTSMAGIVMIYSATAVIHLMVLFPFNRRWDRNTCIEFPLPNGDILPICMGVHDPDYVLAGGLVAANLLAILPFGKWSLSFRKPETQSILVLWMLWLAVGHLFFIFIIPNRGINYKVCPIGVDEPLPGMDFHAGIWDESSEERLTDVVYGRTDTCVYTCYARDSKLGRRREEIGIYPANISNRYLNNHLRGVGIAFWIVYTILALVGLFASKSHDRHPRPVLHLGWWRKKKNAWLENHTRCARILHRIKAILTLERLRRWAGRQIESLRKWLLKQAAWQSLVRRANATMQCITWLPKKINRTAGWEWIVRWSDKTWERIKNRFHKEFESKMGFDSACLVCLVKRYFVQALSAVSFFGFVAFVYWEFVNLPKAELPTAVGQWSAVAAFGFAIFGASVVQVGAWLGREGGDEGRTEDDREHA